MADAPLGLLLDLDGPILSPVARTVVSPTIAPDLVALAEAGAPIVFNTGRSAAVVAERVLPALVSAGLPPSATVLAVCEKGAVVADIVGGRVAAIEVDPAMTVPEELRRVVRRIVEDEFADIGFWDETKLAMASIEQRTDVGNDAFAARRAAMDERIWGEVAAAGAGVRWGEREHAASDGSIDLQIDPSIIATDLESALSGKHIGARLAVEHLGERARGVSWRTVGDSPGDYRMADWLHENGYDVEHVDVRPPVTGTPDRPYAVRTIAGLHDDAAGAAWLSAWRRGAATP